MKNNLSNTRRERVYGRSQKDCFRNDLKGFVSYCKSRQLDIKLTEYRAWARIHKVTSLDSLMRCFGSWRNALAEVGVEAAKSPKASLDELIDYYMEVWKYESESTFDPRLAPTKNRFDIYSNISGKKFNTFTYERRWGLWSDFKNLMSSYQQGLKTKDDVKNKAGKTKKDDPIPSKIYQYVLYRGKRKCEYCGKNPVEDNVKLHVHHVVPRSKGGASDDPQNLKVLCNYCNQQLGDSEIDTKGI